MAKFDAHTQVMITHDALHIRKYGNQTHSGHQDEMRAEYDQMWYGPGLESWPELNPVKLSANQHMGHNYYDGNQHTTTYRFGWGG